MRALALPISPWLIPSRGCTVGPMSGGSGTDAAGADSPEQRAQEAQLARRAADGDSAAFATLYDRYEQRIFTFCQRLTGSADDAADATQEAFVSMLERLPGLTDRDLNFGAYLFTTARHSAYRVMEKRRKAEPTEVLPERGASGGGFGAGMDPDQGDPEEDPERKALVEGQQEQVRAAHARLPERQREVLVLRELEEMSYDEIAEIMDMNRNSVAQLISRARIKLRDELRGEALASIATTSAECEKALPLIAMRDDGQLTDPLELAWLDQHLAGCDTCRASVEAMHEAGVSYRSMAPIVVFAWLRQESIAKAAEHMGFDWSDVPPRSSGSGGSGGSAGGVAAGAAAGAGDAAEAATGVERVQAYVSEHRTRVAAGAAAVVVLLLGGVTAYAVGGHGDMLPPATTGERAADTLPAGATTTAAAEATTTGAGIDHGGTGHKAKHDDGSAAVPVVATTSAGTKTTTAPTSTHPTTVAELPSRQPRTHHVRTHTDTPTQHKPKRTPKTGSSTPDSTPAPTPTPTPDNPPSTATHDDPPPQSVAPQSDPTPPTTTADPTPPTTTTRTTTNPNCPPATLRPPNC
jgi:RNA polymerase sigma factor (sigma-70 family)